MMLDGANRCASSDHQNQRWRGNLLVDHGRIYPMVRDPAEPVRIRSPLRSESLDVLPVIEDGAVGVRDGRIVYVGPSHTIPDLLHALPAVSAEGRAVVPGFVDPHTHIPFAAWRSDEYVRRLRGESYAKQQREDGRRKSEPPGAHGKPPVRGIARSAWQVSAASDEDLLRFSKARIREAMETGTTALEMKSGYGLSAEAEWRLLRTARALAWEFALPPAVTGLFLHAVPPGETAEAWTETVLEEVLPRALREGWLDAVDAFVEPVAFSPSAARRLVVAAQEHGLQTHLHLDQITESGLVPWAAGVGVTSVDHLDHLSDRGVDALAGSPTVAVLLPGATFLAGPGESLPVRRMIEKGVAVALGTDLNPGTAPVASLPECMALAGRLWGLNGAEVLAMTTVNAACALGLDASYGTLSVGGWGDLAVLDGDSPDVLVYRLGHAPVVGVMHRGVWVRKDPELGERGDPDPWIHGSDGAGNLSRPRRGAGR